MSTNVGKVRIDRATEQQVRANEHLEAGEELLRSALVRRKKVRAGFFRRRRIDAEFLALTKDHVIHSEYDWPYHFIVTRIPYSEIAEADVIADGTELILRIEKIGLIVAKLGDEAGAWLEDIQARRDVA